MTEREQYYYNKGKSEGYIEGVQRVQEVLLQLMNSTCTPAPIIIKASDIDPKILEEMKS